MGARDIGNLASRIQIDRAENSVKSHFLSTGDLGLGESMQVIDVKRWKVKMRTMEMNEFLFCVIGQIISGLCRLNPDSLFPQTTKKKEEKEKQCISRLCSSLVLGSAVTGEIRSHSSTEKGRERYSVSSKILSNV